MGIYSDRNLLRILYEISQSLKDVTICNRYDYKEITEKYKNAIFKVKSQKDKIVSNITSSNLAKDNLRQFYEDHACCWVNYIGCDSFSIRGKKQVFFSSVLMEEDNEEENRKLLDINEDIFKIYNKMLSKKIPADLWVQVFFYERDSIKEILDNKPSNDQIELLDQFDSIQKNGFVVPMDYDAENTNNPNSIGALVVDSGIDGVNRNNVNDLWIKKRKTYSMAYEIKDIVESISLKRSCRNYLSRKVFQLNKSLHSKVKFLYYLPAEGANGTTGLIIYGAKRQLTPTEISDLKLLGYNILFPYVSAYKSAWENERVIRESIKSAVSAIMSRNMSHNLGSHYLYYTKVALDDLADKNGQMGPYIRGAAKVLSYIQGRMDYLATIVSNDKYPYGSVNFKSQILDELTIDDFSKRHYGINLEAEFKESVAENALSVNSIKELVNELSILYSQVSKDGDNGSMDQIDKKVEAIELLVKQIDKKSIYNRTTNYLLTNLIKSENYSRPDILEHGFNDSFKKLYLYVSLWNNETGHFDIFTGTNNPEEMAIECDIKDKLSKINLALPGGTMSCHAFYNIIENFIRNSAKYSWTDYRIEEDLKFTISLKIDQQKQSVECIVYDNKHDALRQRDIKHKKTLLEEINSRLSHLRILDDNNMVDKENKGLKEMLFSAVWLKANESDYSFAEIITEIENSSLRRKLSLISKYGFEFTGINDRGFISKNPDEANLALKLTLPLFTHVESLRGKAVKDLIKLHTDVIEVSNPREKPSRFSRTYSQIFPRIYDGTIHVDKSKLKDSLIVEQIDSEEDELNAFKLKQSIVSNLGNIDDYILQFASVKEPSLMKKTGVGNRILFDTHFSTQASKDRIKEYYGQFVYVDTISGSNFTKTLQGLFYSGLNKRKKKYKTYNDLFLSLKIKESALTRITIIDERLFNNIRWEENIVEKLNDESISGDTVLDLRSTAAELTMKNIRILNFLDKPKVKKSICYEKMDKLPFFCGNTFLTLGPCADNPNTCHFLSIHLGLIEKLLKSKQLEKYIGPREGNSLEPTRIKKLMKLLEKQFGEGLTNGVHICIHSGRGNFSKELEGPLKKYPFISLAAIENAFNNSKYLLSQLFYNTIFIGKGEVNH